MQVAPHFRFRFRFLMFPLLEMLELFEPLEPLEPLGLQTGQDCPQLELKEVPDVAPAVNKSAMIRQNGQDCPQMELEEVPDVVPAVNETHEDN